MKRNPYPAAHSEALRGNTNAQKADEPRNVRISFRVTESIKKDLNAASNEQGKSITALLVDSFYQCYDKK